jgi:ribosome-associated translation inhibitor RaiA
MSDQSDRSIKELVKQVYDMWERSAGEQIEKLARSQTFLSAMAQNLDQTLNISQRIKDMTQSTLNMMNLPTQQDVASLSRQIKSMRSTLDEINEKLERRAAPAKSKTKTRSKTAKKTGHKKAQK